MKSLPIAAMAWRLSAALLAVSAWAAVAEAAAPADPSGTWLVTDGRARIRVEKCGPHDANICGYVVWLKTPLNDQGKPRLDIKNPDPKRRNRPSLGHQMIMGLTPNDDGRYEGKVYNSEAGSFVDITLWREEPNELSVRGCMLTILCGSQSWKRVTDILQGQLTAPTNQPNGPRSDPEWLPKPAKASTTAK